MKPVDAFPMDRKIGDEEIKAVLRVLKDKRLTFDAEEQLDRIKKFEEDFSQYLGTKFAIACSSGTAALHISLAAAGIGAGDEVLIPAYTFVATATAVLHQNAIPVFVDIDETSLCIDPEDIKRKITKKTKAIIPVHLFGHPADLDPILEIAEKKNLIIIEDACQAHGAEYKGRKVGSYGKSGCFSFYESKNMMTGEGGIIVTDNEDFAEKCRLIRHHGEPDWYQYILLGYNYRMSQIEAAIGIEQLKKLDKMNEGRIFNSNYLNILLSDIPGIILPQKPHYGTHVFHAYALKINSDILGMSGKELADLLNKDFQITKLIYPKPLYDSILFINQQGYGSHKCPFTCPFLEAEAIYIDSSPLTNCPKIEKLCENIIGLPNWHQLSYIELSLVAMKFIQTIEEILNIDLNIEERIIGAIMNTETTIKAQEMLGIPSKFSETINVGIIGLGNIGKIHAAAFFTSPHTELFALSTRNQLSLIGGSLFFGVTTTYNNYMEMLKNPDIQAVSICTPTFTHKDIIIDSINAGKHILVEKPFLLHPDEYQEISALLVQNKTKLMVAHICRFQTHYKKAKEKIKEIGPLVSMHAFRRGGSPPNWADWFFDIEKSGGIVVDLAIHDIDLVLWYAGEKDRVETVFALGSNSVYPEINTWDTAIINLKFQSGLLATIEASWSHPDIKDKSGSSTGFTINGEDGIIKIDPLKQPSMRITELGSESNLDEMDQFPWFVSQISAFAKSIIEDTEVPITAENGLRALRIAHAAFESLKTGKPICPE